MDEATRTEILDALAELRKLDAVRREQEAERAEREATEHKRAEECQAVRNAQGLYLKALQIAVRDLVELVGGAAATLVLSGEDEAAKEVLAVRGKIVDTMHAELCPSSLN